MPFTSKIFKSHVDNEFSLLAGKEVSAITIGFITTEYNQLRAYLDRNEIVDAFEAYLNKIKAYKLTVNNDENITKDLKIFEELDKHFETLHAKINAYCTSCLEGLKDPKLQTLEVISQSIEKPTSTDKKTALENKATPFCYLDDMEKEMNKDDPAYGLFLQHYEMLKHELARLTNNFKLRKLQAAMRNYSFTSREMEEHHKKCTIL